MLGDVHLKGEGLPLHPDDCDADMTDEQYKRQKEAYKRAYIRSYLPCYIPGLFAAVTELYKKQGVTESGLGIPVIRSGVFYDTHAAGLVLSEKQKINLRRRLTTWSKRFCPDLESRESVDIEHLAKVVEMAINV